MPAAVQDEGERGRDRLEDEGERGRDRAKTRIRENSQILILARHVTLASLGLRIVSGPELG